MRPGGVSFLFDSKTFSHDEATTSTSENSDFLSRCRVDLLTRLEADNWSSNYSRKIAGKAKKKTFFTGNWILSCLAKWLGYGQLIRKDRDEGPVGDELLLLSSTQISGDLSSPGFSCCFCATKTTSNARPHLYSVKHSLATSERAPENVDVINTLSSLIKRLTRLHRAETRRQFLVTHASLKLTRSEFKCGRRQATAERALLDFDQCHQHIVTA